jgi:hypothetical protein
MSRIAFGEAGARTENRARVALGDLKSEIVRKNGDIDVIKWTRTK